MKKFAVALFAAACCAAACASAKAHGFAPYLEAAQQLKTMPSPARLSDPQGAALLAIVGDRQRFLDSAPIGQDDLPALAQVCSASMDLETSYVEHDKAAKVQAITKDAHDQSSLFTATATVYAHNTEEFQDEIALARSFTYQCKARLAPLMADAFRFALAPETRHAWNPDALRRFQDKLFFDFTGILTLAHEARLKPANMQRITKAMADASPVLVAALPLARRKMLLSFAAATPAKVSGQSADDITQILRIMDDTSCDKLCSL